MFFVVILYIKFREWNKFTARIFVLRCIVFRRGGIRRLVRSEYYESSQLEVIKKRRVKHEFKRPSNIAKSEYHEILNLICDYKIW